MDSTVKTDDYSTYYLRLIEKDQERYREKLVVRGKIIRDPYLIPNSEWENKVSKWPPVQYGDIWNYLVNTPGQYTAEAMKAYKSLDGYNYFVSGHVKPILISEIQDVGVDILKTTVIPSQKISDKRQWHECWVTVDKENGYIITAHCSCKAGAGEACSHVAAVLFKIEAAVKLELTQKSKTSVACQWNRYYREKITAEPLQDINFNRPRPGVLGKRKPPIQQKEDSDDDFDEETALKQLKRICPEACILLRDDSDTDSASDDEDLPPVLTKEKPLDVTSLNQDTLEKECMGFLKDFSITETQARNLEIMTRRQADSCIWKRQRIGRVTASIVHDILTMQQKTSPVAVLRRVMKHDRDISGIESVCYGVKFEKVAKRMYSSVVAKEHDNFSMRDSGLVVDTVFPVFAASPDGVRNCSCHGEGLVEVKCSFKHKKMDVCEIPKIDKGFCLEDISLKLKKTHRYYSQVQFQMYVCQKTFCDFVVYTDKGIFCQTVYYDPEFVNGLVNKCTAFAFNHVIPEILGHKIRIEDKQ